MIDDAYESVSRFESRISQAQANGSEYIEAGKDIVDYYNKKGLGGAKYFFYKGVKVFLEGTVKEVSDQESKQIGHKIHGSGEGIIVS